MNIGVLSHTNLRFKFSRGLFNMLFIERTLVCVLPGECFVPNPFIKCSWVFVCELKCNRYHALCLCVVKGVVLTAQLLPNIVSVKPNINAA